MQVEHIITLTPRVESTLVFQLVKSTSLSSHWWFFQHINNLRPRHYVEVIALQSALQEANEKIEELTSILNHKCIIKDFTQCASACAHRIMRHKQAIDQWTKKLTTRGCPDCTLAVARVVVKERLALRRVTYSLTTAALRASAACGEGADGAPLDPDAPAALKAELNDAAVGPGADYTMLPSTSSEAY